MAVRLHVVVLLLALVAASTHLAQAAAPELDCPEKLESWLYESDKLLVCELTAEPWIHSGYLTFYRNRREGDEDQMQSVHLGKPESGYFYNAREENNTVEFRIKRVLRQHFRNYTFVVENTVGMDEKIIELVPADPSQLDDEDSGASRGTVVTFGLLMLAAFTHLQQLI